MKTYWARCAAGLAALALVAAGCGGNNDDETADDVVTAVADAGSDAAATTTLSTSAPTPTTAPTTTAAPAPADPMELLVGALENSANRSVRGDMHIDMGDLLNIAMEFEYDAALDNAAAVMSLNEMMGADGAGFTIEFRFVDEEAYLRFVVDEDMQGQLGAMMPQGWFTVGAEAVADLGLVCPSPLLRAEEDGVCGSPNDYSQMIENLQSAEIVGQADIGGVSTTQVHGTVSLAGVFEGLLGGSENIPGLDAFGDDPDAGALAYDVWIDADGLVRRMSLDLGSLIDDALSGLAADETDDLPADLASMLDVSLETNFYDYDAAITVEAPPASEVLGDFGEMMGDAPGSGEASASAPAAETS